ncbi:PAS/PAC sensor signal transduction histidine kinase [Plesiocystis pacifica SIR-1]|uniref:PAS/PAC sensor signal transduction histidine kinase n=1 Tax=Plesiocystis pacifica SIR-1 TaxID=391625 RepID=A6G496_9BACT|nr:FG-GAP repeat protein [Plesiocystis pacifica]EDM79208.1 PAS/PAC sensor signal transduction histidine kinase [Plesiocystis pacifica SIR-1]
MTLVSSAGCPTEDGGSVGDDELGTEEGGDEADADTDDTEGSADTEGEAGLGPALALDYVPIKGFALSWQAEPEVEPEVEVDTYVVFERLWPGMPFFPVAELAEDGSADYLVELEVPLHLRASAGYYLRACADGACVDSDIVDVDADIREAAGYVKAVSPGENDGFGARAVVSGDGQTLAVSAWSEDGSSQGLGGDPNDDAASQAGAVYVYRKGAQGWAFDAYIKASNAGAADSFGRSLAVSEDGDACDRHAFRGQRGTTVGGDELDDSAANAGAAYVFQRIQGEWQQRAYLKAADAHAGDEFGASVDISADGERVVVGAPFAELEDASGTTSPEQEDAGAAYVFEREGLDWHELARLASLAPEAHARFGSAVSVAGEGSFAAVGAPHNQAGGSVEVFAGMFGAWSTSSQLQLTAPEGGARFGAALDLDVAGETLVVGAPLAGGQGFEGTGKAHVFVREDWSWLAHSVLEANAGEGSSGDEFGASVALSADGEFAAVGAPGDDSAFPSVLRGTGAGLGMGCVDSGAVHLFEHSILDDGWSQRSYVKPGVPGVSDGFGRWVSLSASALELVVGAPQDDGSASGMEGFSDDELPGAGAVWMF